jgi:WhiB family transcriptional regulator, redox-sensing transcriptional regulator
MTKSINPGMSSAESRQFNYLMRIIPIRDQNWIDRAACASHPDPDLWFPKELSGPKSAGGPQESLRAKEAKRICRGCPVRTECLTFALANKEEHGMWAGVVLDKRGKSRSAS